MKVEKKTPSDEFDWKCTALLSFPLICDSGSDPLRQVEKCITMMELCLNVSGMLAGSKSTIKVLDGGEHKDLRKTRSQA